MGGTRFSEDIYTSRRGHRAATGTSAFSYMDDVMSKTHHSGWKVADRLNPKGVKARESRDSKANPESTAIAVLFDVTGSMNRIPRDLQQKLPELFGVLVRKDYITDPAILFGAIGDATCDNAPLQVGQFESGNETEDDFSAMLLEGGGGGQVMESYELAMYFMARHTSCDCFEKRGKKGYFFIIGDERPYSRVKKSEVAKIIGDEMQEDIPIRDILKELKQRWNVFYIIPEAGSYWKDPRVLQPWKELLGQHVIEVEDHTAICETIAMLIGLNEGTIDIDEGAADLADVGADLRAIKSATSAVREYANTAVVKVNTVTKLPNVPKGTAGAIRF